MSCGRSSPACARAPGVRPHGCSAPRECPGRLHRTAANGYKSGIPLPIDNLRKDTPMLTLFYGPGACSMAAHIVLEETGEKYEPRKVDLANGEQRTDAYLKINPQ